MAKTPSKSPAPQRPNRAFYPNKLNGERVQGTISPTGGVTFNHLRENLAGWSGREFDRVSDADVIEYAVTVAVHGVAAARADLRSNGIVK